jgi:cytosine/uracil/thiamine/allantoin permease
MEICVWIISLLISVMGVAKAAHSGQHLFWLIVWPLPVALACTAFIFVRRGFHFQNGVLVLGHKHDGRAPHHRPNLRGGVDR